MIKYLRLKRHRIRADGIRSVLPVVIEKTRRFGPVQHEQKISVKRSVLITGAHQSGKTRWLQRMLDEAPGIWRGKQAMLLRCVHPLAQWIEHEPVRAYAEERYARPWARIRSWERIDAAVAWIEENRPVLLIDDAHLVSGRKLDVLLRMVRAAPITVVTASDEQRIGVSLRLELAARNPQRINLHSEAAYDITPFVIWTLTLAALAAGSWELSALGAGLSLLGRGRRAAKQS